MPSKPTTRCPSAISRLAIWKPMKPALPVTRTRNLITPAFLWTRFAAAVSGAPDRAEMPTSTATASRNRQVRRGCCSARSGQEVPEVRLEQLGGSVAEVIVVGEGKLATEQSVTDLVVAEARREVEQANIGLSCQLGDRSGVGG